MGKRKAKARSAPAAAATPGSSSSSGGQVSAALLHRLGSAPWTDWMAKAQDEIPSGVPAVTSSMRQGDYGLVKALLAALQHGMQLFVQQWEAGASISSSVRQILTLCYLGRMLQAVGTCCCPAPGGVSDEQAAAAAVQVSLLVVQAGLFGSVAAACSCVASVINMHTAEQQQQQQQPSGDGQQQQQQVAGAFALQDSDDALLLADTLLLVVQALSHFWPGGRQVYSPAIVPVIDPTAELALAVLRAPGAAWQPVQDAIGVGWAIARVRSLRASSGPFPDEITGSSSVRQLLLLALAGAVQKLHQLQPAQQQQQQERTVPPCHQQMLQALGLHGEAVPWSHTTSEADPAGLAAQIVDDTIHVLSVFSDASMECGDASSSGGNDTSAAAALPGQQQDQQQQRHDQRQQDLQQQQRHDQQQQDQQQQRQVAALPGLLLEAMALRSIAVNVVRGSKLLGMAVADVELQLPAALAGENAAGVLRMLVQLLPPAIIKAAQEATDYQAAASVFTQAIGDALLVLTGSALATAAALLLQQPQQYSCLLEGALRGLAHTETKRGCKNGVIINRIIARVVSDAVLRAKDAGSSSTALWTADSRQSVFALLISCIKTLQADVAASAAQASSSNGGDDQEGTVRELLQSGEFLVGAVPVLLECISCGSGASSSIRDQSSRDPSSSSTQVAAAAAAGAADRLLVVALARCLVAAGSLLQLLEQLGPATSSDPLGAALCEDSVRAVATLGSTLASVAAAEPGAVPAAVLQQLQQQAQRAGSALSPPPAPVGAVGEQLVAYGAAVAAQLPVQQCCNFHGCTNGGKCSELELASGQSCKCGGCRVARYCSRACQVAHYKGWHKAVCRRLQQQQQRQPEEGVVE